MRNNPSLPGAKILDYSPRHVTVSVVYLKPQSRRENGLVCFRCPFCKAIHTHGSDPGFRGGDGPRVPHCYKKILCTTEQHAQTVFEQLGPDWEFDLREVADSPADAGHLTKQVRARIQLRSVSEKANP